MASEPARDFLQHLADSVACPICYRIYDKPKSLPCGHTFCFECIQCVADGNSYEDEDDDYYYPVCRETEVGCPICRTPWRGSVSELPTNFTVQNLIADSLNSTEWLCRSCCDDDRKLELATARCHDCDRTLCDSCAAGHADDTAEHDLRTLVEKTCEEHRKPLEMYCIRCRTNICVACFLEAHQGHKCEAISKAAKQLIEVLEQVVDELRFCEPRINAVVTGVAGQKRTYEKLVLNLTDCITERRRQQQQLRTAAEAFQMEKTPKNVDSFAKRKLKAVNAIVERGNNGKTVDHAQAIDLLQDVKDLFYLVILNLDSQEEDLQDVLRYVEKLKIRASDMATTWSAADVTEKAAIIWGIREDVTMLMDQEDDEEQPFLKSWGTVPILSSKGRDTLEKQLKPAVEALIDLLMYERLPDASSSPSAAAPTTFIGRFMKKKKVKQRRLDNHRQHQQHDDRAQGSGQKSSGYYESFQSLQKRSPAVLPEPPLRGAKKKAAERRGENGRQQQPVPASSLMAELKDRLAQRAAAAAAAEQSRNPVYSTLPADNGRNVSTASNTDVVAVDDEAEDHQEIEDRVFYANLPIDGEMSNTDAAVVEEEEDVYRSLGDLISNTGTTVAPVTAYNVYDALPPAGDRMSDTANSAMEEYSDSLSSDGTSDTYSTVVEAIYDYFPTANDEISFYAGDVIRDVEDTENDGWCLGTAPNGTYGYFPANFASRVH